MFFVIQGKVAIITGAASGLGFAFARDLLRNGLKGVTVVDVDDNAGRGAAITLCEEFGKDKAIFVRANVNNGQQLENAFQETLNRFVNIDIVINNAGIVDEANWERVIDTNLKGVIRGTMLGLEYISTNKSGEEGLIVNTSSATGLRMTLGIPFYSTAKAGIIMVSRSLGKIEDYKKSNIKIVTICPGFTETPLASYGLDKVYPGFQEIWKKRVEEGQIPKQTASHVSKSLVAVIKKASSGSVWVIENGEAAYELEFPESYGEKKKSMHLSI